MRLLEIATNENERLVLETWECGDEGNRSLYISICYETYQKYDWKEHGWFSSQDEGSLIPVEHLDSVIDALVRYKKALPLK